MHNADEGEAESKGQSSPQIEDLRGAATFGGDAHVNPLALRAVLA
jgi:hypothetical protein